MSASLGFLSHPGSRCPAEPSTGGLGSPTVRPRRTCLPQGFVFWGGRRPGLGLTCLQHHCATEAASAFSRGPLNPAQIPGLLPGPGSAAHGGLLLQVKELIPYLQSTTLPSGPALRNVGPGSIHRSICGVTKWPLGGNVQ